MYKVVTTASFDKELKKLSPEIHQVFFNKWLTKIIENPKKGTQLSGKKLKKIRKYAVRHKKNDYRILYQINKSTITMVLLVIGLPRKLLQKKLLTTKKA